MKKSILLIGILVFTLLSNYSYTQPTASFSANGNAVVNLTICSGDCIDFVDASTPTTGNAINLWSWDFDNAVTPSTYNNQVPNAANNGNICFATVGTFNISLTVDAPDGNDVYTMVLTVDDCPQQIEAGFTYTNNICANDCITMTDTSLGAPIFWSWVITSLNGGVAVPGTSSDKNPEFCFPTADEYQINLQIEDISGTVSNTVANLHVGSIPIVTITPLADSIIELNETINLSGITTTGETFEWSPMSLVDDYESSDVIARPEETTEFVLISRDLNGCTGSDTILVYVNFIPGIGVPTAFSPNNDGVNDLLVVEGLALDEIRFRVYNRYGILVFDTENQKNGWDGNYKGRPENPGVFTWTMEYKFNNDREGVLSGNTTLVR